MKALHGLAHLSLSDLFQGTPIKYGRLQGLIMRYQLITLIQHKVGVSLTLPSE